MSTTPQLSAVSQAARVMQRRSVQARNAKAGQLSLFRVIDGQYVPCTLDQVFGIGTEAAAEIKPARRPVRRPAPVPRTITIRM
jgi:hypothetical protein